MFSLGGGCSCIHALLAVRLNPQWTMYVSEIDPFNYRMAMKNVEQNGLQDRIHSEHTTRLIMTESFACYSSCSDGFIGFVS